MNLLIVLSGPIGVGKSSFGKALTDLFGVKGISTRHWILKQTGCENERCALQEAGDRLDADTGGSWVADAVEAELLGGVGEGTFLLDSARIRGQVETVRTRFPRGYFMCIYTPISTNLGAAICVALQSSRSLLPTLRRQFTAQRRRSEV